VNKNVARGRSTREQLVRAATALFAAHGYEGTSIEAVLTETGVSRGSLYHHFAGKEALFGAVLENLELRVATALNAAAQGVTDPVELLRVGGLTWIRMATDHEVQQIVLTDASAVLGWQRFRELDEQHVLGDIRAALAATAQLGRLDGRHVDMFAHLMLAAINEMALVVARSTDPAAALPEAEAAFNDFVRRLLP
jgi:AcrR family transcriptional regulator